jgi:hypothetical protein
MSTRHALNNLVLPKKMIPSWEINTFTAAPPLCASVRADFWKCKVVEVESIKILCAEGVQRSRKKVEREKKLQLANRTDHGIMKWVVLVWWPWRIATSLRDVCTRTDYILVYSRPCCKELTTTTKKKRCANEQLSMVFIAMHIHVLVAATTTRNQNQGGGNTCHMNRHSFLLDLHV